MPFSVTGCVWLLLDPLVAGAARTNRLVSKKLHNKRVEKNIMSKTQTCYGVKTWNEFGGSNGVECQNTDSICLLGRSLSQLLLGILKRVILIKLNTIDLGERRIKLSFELQKGDNRNTM